MIEKLEIIVRLFSKSLKVFHLDGNMIGQQGVERLVQSLQKNRVKQFSLSILFDLREPRLL